MENNARTGGILSIISGSLGAAFGFLIAAFGVLFGFMLNSMSSNRDFYRGSSAPPEGFFTVFAVIYGAMGLFYILLGAFAIVGGVFAIKRKHWGIALAGSIVGSFAFQFTGIAAAVFTALARNEFKTGLPPASQAQSPVSPADQWNH